MKRIFSLLLLIFLCSGCDVNEPISQSSGNIPDNSNSIIKPAADTVPVTSINTPKTGSTIGPIEFSSFEELAEAKQGNENPYVTDLLADVKFCYIPSEIITKTQATLNSIHVQEHVYICVDYFVEKMDYSRYDDPHEAEIARISNTIQLRQFRDADGNLYLKNTVKEQGLKQLDNEGKYYYEDVAFPSDPNKVIYKSIYWVQDGFMMILDIPITVYEQFLGDAPKDGARKGEGATEGLISDDNSGAIKTEAVAEVVTVSQVKIGE